MLRSNRYRKDHHLPLAGHHAYVVPDEDDAEYPSDGNVLVFREAIDKFVAENPVVPVSLIGVNDGDVLAYDAASDQFTSETPTVPVIVANSVDGNVLVYRDVSQQYDSEKPIVPVSIAGASDGDMLVYRDGSQQFEAESTVLPIDIAGAGITGVPIVWDEVQQVYVPASSLTLYDDLRIPVTSLQLGGLQDPDPVKFVDNGAGSTGVYVPGFSAILEEEMFFTVQFPHTWKVGTTVYPHIHWSVLNTGTGTVVWGLEYSWSIINDVFPNTTIVTATVDAPGVSKKHMLTYFSGGIDATGKEESSMLVCRVFRQGPADSYGSDAILLEVDFHYQIDRIGEQITI